jgi:dTDP-4-amino-4,6-dideoxygalactose transaminase
VAWNFPEFYSEFVTELRQAVDVFLREGQYIDGPFVESFEQQLVTFLGGGHAVGCGSGTHALQLALMAAECEGKEVITVGNTYYATLWAIRQAGARPVFCEVCQQNGLLDPDRLEDCVTARARAVLPVHLYGVPAPLQGICQVAERHGLVVIEDCAHAFGSSYQGQRLGAAADYACFSFYPTKSFGAFGDAGAVVTRWPEQAQRMRALRYFSNADRTVFDPNALHVRLDALQACLLSVNLRHFGTIEQRRRRLSDLYRERLAEKVTCLPAVFGTEITPYVFPILVPSRDNFLARLRHRGIRLQVHYPTNLHWLPEFGALPPGSLPYTERHNAQVLSLPVHPALREEEVETLCDAILECLWAGGPG